MFCPQCGSANPDDARFCRTCAASLPSRTPRPGEESTSGLEAPTAYLPQEPPRPTPPDPDPGYRSSFGEQQPGSHPYTSYVSQNQPPPGYPQSQPVGPSYASAPPPTNSASGRAIASLVLSILSVLLFCCFILSPAMSITGAVLGKMELNAIRQGRAPAAGETMAKIGFYLGVGSAGLWIVWTVINLIFGLVGGLSDIMRNMGH